MTEEKDSHIEYLVDEINHHRYLYYNAQPEISDTEYDVIENELRRLDPNNPILFKLGFDHSELFVKRKHIIPMTSQDKVVKAQDFMKWAKKRNYKAYIIQFKLDGISIELQYKDGIFQYAITRGNGKKGDDVSVNVIRMQGFIPKLDLPFTGAVRAEILLFHDIFNKKYSDKQNCRNTAAGIVRKKDGMGCEDLSLIYYDAISLTDNVIFNNEIDKLKWLKSQGFNTVRTKTARSPQEVIDIREDVGNSIRNTLEYDIDGLVIKGKEIDLDDMNRDTPMKQIAFKFLSEEIKSVLLNVEWSISGHIYTPVAIIKTVKLLGTNVSKANLANPDLIKNLKLKIGSEVIVSKRGDIIPKIERVVSTPSDAKEIISPKYCEACNTTLINEGTRLYCPNSECPKRFYHRIIKWIKKLNIVHFSEKLMLRPLFDFGKIQTIADLYKLAISDLTLFNGVKETSAQKALNNLFKVKEIPLAKFIAGFDIEKIGERLVQRVIDAGFDTLKKIRIASISQISRIDGFATHTAKLLINGVNLRYIEMKELLDTEKIKIKEASKMEGKLENLSFCFTGKLNTLKRAEAEELVREHGGQFKSNVVKNLSYLVTNSNDPTSKYVKAQNQGTHIITEDEFLKMIE